MDISQIGAAYTGVKFIRESLSAILNARIETAAKEKVNEVLERLGAVQDTLFYVRDELGHLQTENLELREKLKAAEDWKAKLAEYELKETQGGAIVFQFKGEPRHYICPSCMNKKEVQILQRRKDSMSGDFECPGCNKYFPIEPHRDFNPPSGGDDWSAFR
jgi:regulator of replication initiation timing